MESADSVGSTDRAPDTEPPTGRKRRILAAILSAAIPGVGHWLLGTKRTGTWLFSIFCVLILLYWPLRLPKSYWSIQVLLFATAVLCVVAAWSALRTRSQRANLGSYGCLILLVPLAGGPHRRQLVVFRPQRDSEFPLTGLPATAVPAMMLALAGGRTGVAGGGGAASPV